MTQVWNLASKIHLAILLIINLNLFSLSLLFFINFNFHYNRTPFSSDIIDTFFNDFHPSPEFHTSRLSALFPSPHSRYYHPMMLHRPDWNCPVRTNVIRDVFQIRRIRSIRCHIGEGIDVSIPLPLLRFSQR